MLLHGIGQDEEDVSECRRGRLVGSDRPLRAGADLDGERFGDAVEQPADRRSALESERLRSSCPNRRCRDCRQRKIRGIRVPLRLGEHVEPNDGERAVLEEEGEGLLRERDLLAPLRTRARRRQPRPLRRELVPDADKPGLWLALGVGESLLHVEGRGAGKVLVAFARLVAQVQDDVGDRVVVELP